KGRYLDLLPGHKRYLARRGSGKPAGDDGPGTGCRTAGIILVPVPGSATTDSAGQGRLNCACKSAFRHRVLNVPLRSAMIANRHPRSRMVTCSPGCPLRSDGSALFPFRASIPGPNRFFVILSTSGTHMHLALTVLVPLTILISWLRMLRIGSWS